MTPAKVKKKELPRPPVKIRLSDQFQIALMQGMKRPTNDGDKENNGEIKRKRGRPRKVPKEDPEKKRETKLTEIHHESTTAFMDFPDEIFASIFSVLDPKSRLKLRVNKRLDKLYFLTTKNHWKNIDLHIGINYSRLIMFYNTEILRQQFAQVEWIFRRFACNTIVDKISIVLDTVPNEEHSRTVDALFHIRANEMVMISSQYVRNFNLAHLHLPSFLTLLQNVRHVNIWINHNNLSAQDLCAIRKAMLQGGFTKSFEIWVVNEMSKSFMQECLGVAIEYVSKPIRGKIYRSDNESLELYQRWDADLAHFEGDLRTTVESNRISFEKLGIADKPADNKKINLNWLYETMFAY